MVVLQMLFAPGAQNQSPSILGFCVHSGLYVVCVSLTNLVIHEYLVKVTIPSKLETVLNP
jgi:hypothetical protein